ncbi:phospholipase [Nonomuraea sp. NPDC049709]|uniref:phospholipase n=1 Tax=Nonomuraea sp. NPDC049709 TaxID=3154736 RepID=UPI00342E67F9
MVGRFLAALAPIIVFAHPAPAYAVTLEQKLSALSALTSPTSAGAAAWYDAWLDRASWTAYAFDWSTDLCSGSPDQPLGFDFRMPCRRHDFGYRNYRAVSRFAANKEHVDSAFLFDMRQVCAGYEGVRKEACDRLARSYHQAVQRLGALVVGEGIR